MTIWTSKVDARELGQELLITNEAHVIGEDSSSKVYLLELPLEETPSSVVVLINGVTATQVTSSPAAGQCVVDYAGANGGTITFNGADNGKSATVTYYGRGSTLYAKDINRLQTLKVDADTYAAHTHSFTSLTGKPTTLVGYGITNCYTKTEVDGFLAAKSDVGHTHAFASLTSLPTTIAGFGITDAYTKTEVNTALAGKSDTSHTHSFASLTSKPTTIAGYGITDAVSSSGTSASGTWGISITGSAPTLTTARTLWGQSFNGSANVSGPLTGVTSITASGDITTSGNLIANSLTVNLIVLNGITYTFPAAQIADSFLHTDGTGTLTWVTVTSGGGGGGSSDLAGLSDVSLSGLANGQFLKYNGSAWVNSTDGSALTALNASNVASGSLADARLSSNVVLKNAANVFSLGQSIRRTLGTDAAISLDLTGDTQLRWTIAANGKQQWGSGSVAPDTNLYRSAANTLTTDSTFDTAAINIAGTSVITSAKVLQNITGITTSGTISHTGATANVVQVTGAATVNVGSDTASTSAMLSLRAVAGSQAMLAFRSGTLARWAIYKNVGTETGSDAGAGFFIAAYDDSGTLIDNVVAITRAAGGVVAFNRPVTTTSTINGQTLSTSAHLTGSLLVDGPLNVISSATFGNPTGGSGTNVSVQRSAGQRGTYRFLTGTTLRWSIAASETAEGGSNTGSNFWLLAYDDTGVNIDTPISITRAATGGIAFAANRPITGGTYNAQTISSVANLTGTLTLASTFTQNGTSANLVQSTTSSTLNVGTGTGTSTTNIAVRSAAGQLSYIAFRSGNLDRWIVGRNTAAESGSDAGSPFFLSAYDDTGVFIDSPMTITRIAGGAMSLSRPVSMGSSVTINGIINQTNATASFAQSTTTATLNVGSGTGSGASVISLRGAAGQLKSYDLLTGTNLRWRISSNTTAETGADAGANFALNAYTDGGVFIDSPMSIARIATGAMTISRPIIAQSTFVLTSTLTTNGTAANLVQSSTASSVMIGNGVGSGATTLAIRAAAGQQARIDLQTGAAGLRWAILRDSAAESGSNAGSPFIIRAYDDSAVFIDDPVTITRAAAGVITFARTITQNATVASFVQSTTTSSVNIGSGTGSGVTQMLIRGAAGQTRQIVFNTGASSNRWAIQIDTVAEAGSDAGSAFRLSAFSDSSVFIDQPLVIARAAGGTMTLNRPLIHNATTATIVQSTTTAVLTIGTGTGSSFSLVSVRAAAGQTAGYYIKSGATTDRWSLIRGNTAETGSNTGSPFLLDAYDDTGAFIDNVISVIRASGGAFTLGRPLVAIGTATFGDVSAITSPAQLKVGGDVRVSGTDYAADFVLGAGTGGSTTSGSPVIIYEEGSLVTSEVASINFVGSGVTASGTGGTVTVTITSDVTSVFGRTGVVTANTGDYTFAQIGSKPTTIAGYGITDYNSLGDARWAQLAAANTFSARQTFTGTNSSSVAGISRTDVGIGSGAGGRITLEHGGNATLWELDNSSGVFRIFNPGSVRVTLSTTLMTLSVPLALGSNAINSVTSITMNGALSGVTTINSTGTATLAQSATAAQVTIGTGTGSGATTMTMRALSGQLTDIIWQTGTVNRWVMRFDSTADTIALLARNDDGTPRDQVIGIGRTLGSTITFARPLAMSSNAISGVTSLSMGGALSGVTTIDSSSDANLAQTTTAAIMRLGTGTGSGSTQFAMRAASGQLVQILLQTASINRWVLGKNTGETFFLDARDSAGTLISTVLSIPNAAGNAVTFGRPIAMGANSITGVSTMSVTGLITATLGMSLAGTGDITSLIFHNSYMWGGNLRYIGSGDPTLAANMTYIADAGVNNIAGIMAWIRSNGTETGNEFSIMTAPTSTGAGTTPASLTKRFRVLGTGQVDVFGNLIVGTSLTMGGALTGVTSLTMNGALSGVTTITTSGNASLAQSTTSGIVVVGTGSGSSTTQLQLRALNGQQARVDFTTGSSLRWGIVRGNDTESTGNLGSSLQFNAYDDAGALIGIVIQLPRVAGGTILLGRSLNLQTNAISGVTSLAMGGALSGVTTVSMSSTLTMTAAASQIIPGTTSFAVRNHANTANNIFVTDAGAITLRSTLTGVTSITMAGALAGATTGDFSSNVTIGGTLAIGVVTTIPAATARIEGDVRIGDGVGYADDFVLTDGSGGIPITGGTAPITIYDEGVSLTPEVTSINFVGAGVVATNTAGDVTVTITNAVTSVFGRTGVVVAATNDYTFAQIGSKPTTIGGYGITDFNSLGDARWLGIAATAAAATVLATTRTIWGQNFNGSANVTGAMTGVTSLTMGGALSGVTTLSMSGALTMTLAASQIIPGATSWAVRNNANTANNIIITDAGAVTFRSTVGGITTLTATTIAGTLSTATQNSVTTMTNLTTIGTLVAGTVPAARVSAGTFQTGAFAFNGALSGITTLSMSGALTFTSASKISAPADSKVLLQNNAGTDFSLLQFGGTTASFPAINRQGAGLWFVLADGSTFASITAQNGTFGGYMSVSGAQGWVVGSLAGVQRITWVTDHFELVNPSNALAPLSASTVTATSFVGSLTGSASQVGGIPAAQVMKQNISNTAVAGDADARRQQMTFIYPTAGAPSPSGGAVISFGGFDGGYDTQIHGAYNGVDLWFRNRNGDTGVWSGWKRLFNDNGNGTLFVPGAASQPAIICGTSTGQTLATGSLDLHGDIGMLTTQGIVIGGSRVIVFTSGTKSLTTTGAGDFGGTGNGLAIGSLGGRNRLQWNVSPNRFQFLTASDSLADLETANLRPSGHIIFGADNTYDIGRAFPDTAENKPRHVYAATSVTVGHSAGQPALTGVVRMPNNQGVYGRRAANDGDIHLIGADTSNHILVGGGMGSGYAVAMPDINTGRGDVTGVIYFGNQSGGSRYLYYDGTGYVFPTAAVYASDFVLN